MRDCSGKPTARNERELGTESPAERECGSENDVRRENPLRHAQKMRAKNECESGVDVGNNCMRYFGVFALFLRNLIFMPVQYYLFLGFALFCLGVMGVLMRRNAIVILMCIELMLNAVNLLMVTFSKMHQDPAGQIFVFFIMVVAAAEVSVGLAIIVMMFRKVRSIDINILNRLKN